MSSPLPLDAIDEQVIRRLIDELGTLAHAIVATPKWRWWKRSGLQARYRAKQGDLGGYREFAEQHARDRILASLAVRPPE